MVVGLSALAATCAWPALARPPGWARCRQARESNPRRHQMKASERVYRAHQCRFTRGKSLRCSIYTLQVTRAEVVYYK
jgi:hypothetical protein